MEELIKGRSFYNNGPIIIYGTGRSGTTIISEILFSQREVAWPSNYSAMFPKNLEFNLVRNVFQNRFWNVQGQKQQLNKISSLNKILFKPSEAYSVWNYLCGPELDFSRSFLSEPPNSVLIQNIRNYFNKLIYMQGCNRLGFKYTGPSRLIFMNAIFPNATYVEVVRDPLPTISSFLNTEFWKERGMKKLWWKGGYSKEEIEISKRFKDNPVLMTAFQYSKLRNISLKELLKTNVNNFTINYKDFVEKPNLIIEEVTDFLNLEIDEGISKYMKNNIIYKRNKSEKIYFDAITRKNIDLILNEDYDSIIV